MHRYLPCWRAGLWLAVALMLGLTLVVKANPKERIDYWRSNYAELTPADDPRVGRAQAIFTRVLHAAGSKPGVVPRLLIIKDDPWDVALPMALPDGWILLSKGILDTCYRHPTRGDDRLAFLLGHEIAHQLKDDFWHVKFFQALDASKSRDAQQRKYLEEVRQIARVTHHIQAKELQADEHGIVYATMAGFQPQAIVTDDDQVNFFREWAQALDPQRLESATRDKGPPAKRGDSGAAAMGALERTHPTPPQRAEAVRARLRQVLDKTAAFEAGLAFYYAGDYPQAILAFEHFLHFFPSREVYHNLALSHHQLALQYYQQWQGDALPLPFQLSLGLEPVSRASLIALRSTGRDVKPPEALFREHLAKAVELYSMAISLDPSYALAYSNLGCALLLQDNAYKAIATLQDGLKLAPEQPELLNNLGVALAQADHLEKAQASLTRARDLAPTYAAPVFNLGKIAQAENRHPEAQRLWAAYATLEPGSPWLERLRPLVPLPPAPVPGAVTPAKETLQGVAIATFEWELPAAWGKPTLLSQLLLQEEPFTFTLYAHGAMTLVHDKEIVLIKALESYRGTSSRGIAIGSAAQDVLARYGPPSRLLAMTQGDTWVYAAQGIAFQVRQHAVVSWWLF